MYVVVNTSLTTLLNIINVLIKYIQEKINNELPIRSDHWDNLQIVESQQNL